MKLLFYIHKKLYGYPCREHVRVALVQGRANSGVKHRVAMFYLCGCTIEEIANTVGITKDRVKQLLTIICLGVKV